MTRGVVFTGDIFRLQSRGGISRYFLELFRRLRRPAEIVAGWHRSQVLADDPRVTRAHRASVFPGSARLYALGNAFIDGDALRQARRAIVHPTYYRDPGTLPRRLPLVATVFDMAHERHPEHFRRHWWSARDPARHKRALCERADAIVCISEATRHDLLELLPVPPGKTRVVHLAAPDWSAVVPRPIEGATAPFFLWVGERAGYKNFPATLGAWAACREARDTTLLCLGGGPLGPDERAAAESLHVASRVRQVDGSDRELRWAYENALGLVYTSLWEGFGIPVLEAMSLGCPVVASDRPVIREVAGHGAILVEPTQEGSLTEGIARCLAAPRGGDVARARSEHAARFSWQGCADAHESLYSELDG
jgi:glycosyltransferase involved in cell wall biosynthesis